MDLNRILSDLVDLVRMRKIFEGRVGIIQIKACA